MLLWSVFLRLLMRHRSVDEITRGFWYVVFFFASLMFLAFMAQALLPR